LLADIHDLSVSFVGVCILHAPFILMRELCVTEAAGYGRA
jgi:hypothetical protein